MKINKTKKDGLNITCKIFHKMSNESARTMTFLGYTFEKNFYFNK